MHVYLTLDQAQPYVIYHVLTGSAEDSDSWLRGESLEDTARIINERFPTARVWTPSPPTRENPALIELNSKLEYLLRKKFNTLAGYPPHWLGEFIQPDGDGFGDWFAGGWVVGGDLVRGEGWGGGGVD